MTIKRFQVWLTGLNGLNGSKTFHFVLNGRKWRETFDFSLRFLWFSPHRDLFLVYVSIKDATLEQEPSGDEENQKYDAAVPDVATCPWSELNGVKNVMCDLTRETDWLTVWL